MVVDRSQAGLKKGDVVKIRYSYPNLAKVRVAGSWPSEVRKGKRYKAWLRVVDKERKRFHSTAASGSFEEISVKQS